MNILNALSVMVKRKLNVKVVMVMAKFIVRNVKIKVETLVHVKKDILSVKIAFQN